MFRLEFGQLDTLVELAVIDDNNRFASARRILPSRHTQPTTSAAAPLPLGVHHELVVDAELALGHSGQVGLHHDFACNVCRQHLSWNR